MSPVDDTTLLRHTPGFRDVDEEAAAAMLASATPRALAAGETLFAVGEAFRNEVYFLRRGAVELRRASGRVERPPPGYLLGLSSYLGDSPYASTAVATEPSEVLAVPADHLRALERIHPTLFDAVNRLIALGLRARGVTATVPAGSLAHPVRSAMSAPLATCAPELPIGQALSTMEAANVGSLVVVDQAQRLQGIVTHKSLAAALARQQANAETDPVALAVEPAVTLADDAPLWRAQDVQERDRIKYVVVVENGRPVGMLSQTDVVRVLVSRQSGVESLVARAPTHEDLASHYSAMGEVGARSLEANRRARVAVRVLSEVHLAIQRRCVELTLAEMESEGAGPAPCAYALIIMGSGGRREMMLDPDQDNGIILADSRDAKADDAWIETFTDKLNVNLDRVGYVLCPGDIMARNPMYRKTLADWRAQIDHMARYPNEKAARWSNIVFDFDTLYGDDALTRELRRHVCRVLRDRPRLLQYMVHDDAQGRAPISWFNRLVATGKRDGKDTVDVKRNGLRIVANAVRILALRAGIEHTNTSDRMEALVRRGVLSADFGATVSAAYDELLDILLMHQVEQSLAGRALDKEVAPEDLTPPARDALRVAMRAVKRLQDFLQSEIGGLEF